MGTLPAKGGRSKEGAGVSSLECSGTTWTVKIKTHLNKSDRRPSEGNLGIGAALGEVGDGDAFHLYKKLCGKRHRGSRGRREGKAFNRVL